MPQIEISTVTFKRLQNFAEPLVDDIGSVLERIVDHYEKTHGPTRPPLPPPLPRTGTTKNPRNFAAGDPPTLTFTKIKKGSFGGRDIGERPKWADLVRISLERGFTQLGGFDELRRATDARIVNGIKTDEGYSPLGDLGFSVQGVDAQEAWRIAYGLAKRLLLDIEVVFEWREKEEAAFPGAVGRMAWDRSKL